MPERTITDIRIEYIRRMRASGETEAAIAAECVMTVPELLAFCVRHLSGNGAKHPLVRSSEGIRERVARIRELRKTGIKEAAIARELGISAGAYQKFCVTNHVPRRGISDPCWRRKRERMEDYA